jgi:hypothetical protein
MEIKLGYSNLDNWQKYQNQDLESHNVIVPGIRVCSSSNRKYLGVITDVPVTTSHQTYKWDRESEDTTDTRQVAAKVTVYWQTGPNKGKIQVKSPDDLVNYDAYKARITKELDELKKTENAAAKVGM